MTVGMHEAIYVTRIFSCVKKLRLQDNNNINALTRQYKGALEYCNPELVHQLASSITRRKYTIM